MLVAMIERPPFINAEESALRVITPITIVHAFSS